MAGFAQGHRHALGGLGIDIGNDHPGALLGQTFTKSAAHAIAATGHDDDLVLYLIHYSSFLQMWVPGDATRTEGSIASKHIVASICSQIVPHRRVENNEWPVPSAG